jgi:hypothetical protein
VSAYITLISFGSSLGAVEEAVSTNINAGRQFYLRMFAIDYVLKAVVDFRYVCNFLENIVCGRASLAKALARSDTESGTQSPNPNSTWTFLMGSLWRQLPP